MAKKKSASRKPSGPTRQKKVSSSKGRSTKKKKSGKRKQSKSLRGKLIRFGLLLLAAGVLSMFALFGAVYIGLFGPLPTAEELAGIKNSNAAEIYSSDGKLLGKYFVQNRSSIGYDEIPPVVVEALIATEDNRFFEHEGIDFYSIPRVVVKTILLGDRSSGGGSTISQQLIKNVFGRKNYGALSIPVNKLKENITALKLEELYSKEEIITLYLNTVSFGENVYGIKAASQRFFGKNTGELEVEEAATLIGMLKATTSYNPRLHPEESKERRNTVLHLMERNGAITSDQLAVAVEEPLDIDYHRYEGSDGPAPYLRFMLRSELEEILENTDRGDGTPYNLYTDGLRIDLTVNAAMQSKAESALKAQMKELQKQFETHWKNRKPWGNDEGFLWRQAERSNRYVRLKNSGVTEEKIREIFRSPTELLVYDAEGYRTAVMSPLDSVAYHQMILRAGFFAVEASTGRVLAYVGGIDFSQFPYDHVFSRRQPGSTFKPFVYTAALEAGYEPCDFVENEPIIFSNADNWSPENADGKYGGLYSLKGGLAHSVNIIAARLMAEIGPAPVRDVAHRMGISSDLPNVPSLALGVADLSLGEMVTAYAPFLNGGKAIEPIYIERITDADGKEIYIAGNPKMKTAIDPKIAATMREMLRVVADSGTARRLYSRYHITTEMGGKTGTTQDNADGWFIGLTPKVVCGAWVGAESPLVRFRSTALGQGAATALPIVAQWVKSCETDPELAATLGRKFPATDSDIRSDLDCPMYIESRTDHFFDQLFGRDRPDEPSEVFETPSEKNSGEPEEEEKEGGWIRNLFDKLKGEK